MNLDLFDVIVAAVTVLMAAFVAVWWCFPSVRAWMEAPKYRILTWPQGATRKPDAPTEQG